MLKSENKEALVQASAIDQIQAAPRSVLDVIFQVANNPEIDAAKMGELLILQKEIMKIEAEKSFNVSLAALQAEMQPITKHGKGNNAKYARYEDIDASLRPLLTKNGFSYIFVETENKGVYKGTLLHKDGHSMTGYFEAPPDTSGKKNDIQAIGSSRSYARRYIFVGLLNIVTVGEDDDAQTFSYITPVQVAEIEKRIVSDEIDREKFLKQVGVDSIEHIPATMFETVIRAINERAAKKALKEKEVIVE